MRRAVRAIITHDNQLLLMQRNKFGSMYYTLLGGAIDIGETPEQALRREMMEEASIEVGDAKLVIIEDAGDMYGMQYIYHCEYIGGEPKINPISMEAKINEGGQNTYHPVWLPFSALPNTKMVSEEVKNAVIDMIKNGYPDEPLQLEYRG